LRSVVRGAIVAGVRDERSTTVTASATAAAPVPRDRATLVRWIHIDAVVSGLFGVAMLAGAPVLDGLFGVSDVFLAALGAFILAYGATLLLLVRAGTPLAWARAVVVGNIAWAALGVVAVLADWLTLTAAGTVVALAQAGATAVLAELQYMALRRAS
jgi:hypothetical protein